MPTGNYQSVLSHGLIIPATEPGPTPTDPASFNLNDDADGTGFTADVTESEADAENVFYASRLEAAGLTFTQVGSRTGNGSAAVVVTPGPYVVYMTTGGVFSGVKYGVATSGALAVATRCRRAVCDTIRPLSIPPAARVYEQSFPDPGNVSFPCVLVTVDGVEETSEQTFSQRDDFGRPVKVQIADRFSKGDHERLASYEFWREKITRCFVNQQLAGVPESVYCKIEPYVILDPNLPQFEYMVSGFVVRCVCREPRGVGV